MLEAGQHEFSSFVTLTYGPDFYPRDGSVSVREAQLFLKRLRERIGKFRYYLVGEYGERTFRPHYHAALFSVRDGLGVSEAWGRGFVHVSGLGVESAAYIAGYCCKGMQSKRGLTWIAEKLARPELALLRPEFALMSRRPGIGAAAADAISSFYSSRAGSVSLSQGKSVSAVVRFQRKMWPLGRYLRQRVMDGVGIDRDAASRVRQLGEAEELKAFRLQEDLNGYIDRIVARSNRSGLVAESRFKRKRLERKL